VTVTDGVGVSVDVTEGVRKGVWVVVGVGEGNTYTNSPISQFNASIVLTIKLVSSYGGGTSKTNGNVDTVATYTQLALNESQL
jgi:hypothetical protein